MENNEPRSDFFGRILDLLLTFMDDLKFAKGEDSPHALVMESDADESASDRTRAGDL